MASSSSKNVQRPRFLEGALDQVAARHTFAPMVNPRSLRAATGGGAAGNQENAPRPTPEPPAPESAGAAHGEPEASVPFSPSGVEGPPEAPPRASVETAPAQPAAGGLDSRVEAAVVALKLLAERLAEQARSDALEIGFMVARRILEREVAMSPQPLFALIRSAIRRAGESRKIIVRVCPADLVRLQASANSAEAGALTLAHVELVSDETLQLGDCLVEGDLGTVDGRLSTRLAELARAIDQAKEDAA